MTPLDRDTAPVHLTDDAQPAGPFRAERGTLLCRFGGETIRIEPWGPDALRTRARPGLTVTEPPVDARPPPPPPPPPHPRPTRPRSSSPRPGPRSATAASRPSS
jgi:hypothetical protein